MKTRYICLTVGIIACLIAFSSCRSFDETNDSPVMAQVELSLDHQSRSNSQMDDSINRAVAANDAVKTMIITAVPGSTTEEGLNWDTTRYDSQLLDLNTDTVSLQVPLDQSIRLWESDHYDTITPADKFANQTTGICGGLSDPFTISSGTTEKTVAIDFTLSKCPPVSGLFENFSSGGYETDFWVESTSGTGSSISVVNGELVMTATNDPASTIGKAQLRFKGSRMLNFQAYKAQVKHISFSGTSYDYGRARLMFAPFSTQTRVADSQVGNILAFIGLRVDGTVRYWVQRCDDADCNTGPELISSRMASGLTTTDYHTLAAGFDGSTLYFQVNDITETFSIDQTTYPVVDADWGWAQLYARTLDSNGLTSFTISTAYDDVYVGSISDIFPATVTNSIVGTWYITTTCGSASWVFNSDGTFTYTNQAAVESGTYTFETTVSTGSRHTTGITITSDNGGADCVGDTDTLLGGPTQGTVYSQFHGGGNILAFYQVSAGGTAGSIWGLGGVP